MSSELYRAAYSVLLPAFGDLNLDDNVRRYPVSYTHLTLPTICSV